MSAPLGSCYNFYDSSRTVVFMPTKYWFAAELNDLSVVWIDEQLLAKGKPAADRLLLRHQGGGESPADHHRHMDGGSFVYECDGVRWAIELGMHNYNYFESRGVKIWGRKQNSQRWSIFRIGLDSHNALTINGKCRLVASCAELFAPIDKRRRKGVLVDLTSLYADDAAHVVRHAAINADDNLTLTDQITNGAKPSEVVWKMATFAQPSLIDTHTICLEQEGIRLYLTLDAPSKGEAFILPEHDFKPYEIADREVHRVGSRLQLAPGEEQQLRVRLTPTPSK